MKNVIGNTLDVLRARMDNYYLTLGDLKRELDQLTEEQLKQPAQIFPPTPLDHVELQPVISFDLIGTQCGNVDGEQLMETRGCEDNKHHPEHYVIVADHLPFDRDGNISFEWKEGGDLIGDNGNRYIESTTSLEFEDNKVVATYVRLKENQKSVKTVEAIEGSLNLDYNKDGELIGIEILQPFDYTVK